MASEPGLGDGKEEGSEKQRFSEYKVYKRRCFKGEKKQNAGTMTPETNLATSAVAKGSEGHHLTAPVTTAAPESITRKENNNEMINSCSEALPQNDATPASAPNVSHVDAPSDLVSVPEPEAVVPTNTKPDSVQICRNNVQSSESLVIAEPSGLNHELGNVEKSPIAMQTEVPGNQDPDPASKEKSPHEHEAAQSNATETGATSPSLQLVIQDSQDQAPRDIVEETTQPQATVTSVPEQDHGNAFKSPNVLQVVDIDAAEQNYENRAVGEGENGQTRLNLPAQSRQGKIGLRRKLESDLVLVRSLVRRIEAKEGEISRSDNSRALLNDNVNIGGRIGLSDVTTVGTPREIIRQSRPLSQLRVSVLDNNQRRLEPVEKEKRTPKANQFYANSQFLLAKDKFPPADTNKKSKGSTKKQAGEVGQGFGPGSKVFKNCSALLERLMKHKHGWVFNAPVDVKGLGLHDYYSIIKHPMDLGTVKSRLTKNWYKAPREFAEDIRLTFNNAMTYNPKGQDVHIMAEQLLKIFEEKWAVIEADYNCEMRSAVYREMNFLSPVSRKTPIVRPSPMAVRRPIDRQVWSTLTTYPQTKPLSTTPSGRTPSLKKPKANEPNKRDMTYEEKQKLSVNLQSLPSEKLDQIVHIVKKRNSALSQRDDEIEVDIDSVDAETLWELDRFVTNYKKSLSKQKRKAELAIQARAEAQRQEKTATPITVEAREENNTVSGHIVSASLPQGEKQRDNNGSRSSSSSSSSSDSSSSSSGSDSDSSSSSGSESGRSRQT